MTIEQVVGGLWIPTPLPWGTANPALANLLMDASGEKVAFIIQVPKTGTLRCFEFLTGAALQSPANGFTCSFQDVDMTTGNPDGVIDQYRGGVGAGADSWITPSALTSDGTDTGTKRTVVRGEFLACVIEFSSFVVLDSINIRIINLDANSFVGNPPYPTLFTLSWAKSSDGLVMALKYDDGTYETILGACYPFESIGSTAYNIDSGSGDEYALAFSLPSDIRVGAYWVRANLSANADLILYDSDGNTILETVSLDTNLRTQSATQYHLVRSPTDRLLYANEVYRLSLKPTTTSNVTIYHVQFPNLALMDTMEGGVDFFQSVRYDGGAWVDSVPLTLSRPMMGIIVTGVDRDISGGGAGPGWLGTP